MLQIWLVYNLILALAILGTSLTSARSLTNYLLPLVLLPLIYYLSQDLRRQAKRRRGLSASGAYATSLPQVQPVASDTQDQTALSGELLGSNVSDDNRRLFLKLIGSTSLSIFFMAVMGKGSAKAAFFGSVPGPGTVAVKNSSGVTIDPAESQPTDGYEISEVDDSTTPSYYGFVHKTGAWYITKEDSSGGYRYAKGASAFSTSWTGRAGLSYDYFDNVF